MIMRAAQAIDVTGDLNEARTLCRTDLDEISAEYAVIAGAILSSFRCAPSSVEVHELVNKIQNERHLGFRCVHEWLDARLARVPASRKLSALDLARLCLREISL